ncbi:MAG: amidase [Myxococcota bacterium]|nr:amidase [Myxococcota bacterium]MDW8362597.1 amidase family protein [Myxococcales bacterium]
MELHTLGARELVAGMQRGELGSRELVEALQARARRLEPALGALVVPRWEQALEEARERDEERARGQLRGPLHGLPLTIKESIDLEGTASTLGMRARLGHRADRDAVVVALARRLGAVVIGKTNVPQTLLSGMDTDNRVYGRTVNPWNRERVPGGSSGGEAAALASGISALGIGTDIGGSIRLPACFCGVAGLRPTVHRWSNVGSRTAIAGQETIRSQIGPMARSAADVAFLFAALDPRAQAEHDPAVAPLAVPEPDSVSLRGLRVGFYDDDGFVTPAASVRRAVGEAVEALRDAGAELVPLQPVAPDEVALLMFAVLTADGQRTLARALDGEDVIEPLRTTWRVGRMPPAARALLASVLRARGESRVGRLLEVIGRKGVDELWALTARRNELQLRELESWRRAQVEAVVCPAAPVPAARHGEGRDFALALEYTFRYNVLNFPAGVVPVTRVRADETRRGVCVDRLDRRAAAIEDGSEGLPIGVQVVGKPWREHVVLAVMMAIEARARRAIGFPWTPIDPMP